MSAITEVEAEVAKQKLATKELKDATKAVQANRQKVRCVALTAHTHTHTHTHTHLNT